MSGEMAAKGPEASRSGEDFLAGGFSAAAEAGNSSRACFLPVMSLRFTFAKFADILHNLARSSEDLSRSASNRIFAFLSSWRSKALAQDGTTEPAKDVAATEEGAAIESSKSKIGVLKVRTSPIPGLFSGEGERSLGVPWGLECENMRKRGL